jgi:hypothetical protein
LLHEIRNVKENIQGEEGREKNSKKRLADISRHHTHLNQLYYWEDTAATIHTKRSLFFGKVNTNKNNNYKFLKKYEMFVFFFFFN